MPTKPQTSTVYVGGEEPEVVKKRLAYEQALEKLSTALEARQQRMFDPALLNLAAGFLTPSKTGSFWESLGTAAKGYAAGEQERQKEAQDIAQQQMNVASAGLEIERQRQQDKALRSYLGGMLGEPAAQTAPLAPAGALPSPTAATPAGPAAPTGPTAPVAPLGGPAVAPAAPLMTAAKPAAPAAPLAPAAQPAAQPAAPISPAAPQYGVQIMPEDPFKMTGKKFIAMNMGTMPTPDLLKEAARIDAENVKTSEGGVYNLAQGRYFPSVKGDMVKRVVYGYGPNGEAQEVNLSPIDAMELDRAQASNDPAAYAARVQRIKFGPGAGVAPAAGAAEVTGAEAPGAPKALPSISEQAAQAKSLEELKVQRAKTAAQREADLPKQNEAATRAFQAAADTQRIVNKNPNAFGALQGLGVVPAILNAVSEGIQTPGGSISIPQLDKAVVQAVSNSDDPVEKKNLIARQIAARNLAELELSFRRQYFAGYGGGAISDMEQKIVSKLSSSPTEAPETIMAKMQLVKMRAQYDMNEYRNWIDYANANPDKSYTDFERSKGYLKRQQAYSDQLARTFGTEAATPKSAAEEAKAVATPSGGKYAPDAIQNARKRLLGIGG